MLNRRQNQNTRVPHGDQAPGLVIPLNQLDITPPGYKRLVASFARRIWAVVATYWPVRNYPFINFDDNLYVTENPLIQRGLTAEHFTGAFTDQRTGLWIPLTWLSFMLEADLHGLKPGRCTSPMFCFTLPTSCKDSAYREQYDTL